MSDRNVVDSRGRARVQTINDEPSRTVQSDAHKVDLRAILSQYGEFGLVDSLNQAEMTFADVSDFTDYSDMMMQVREAETEFMKLPSKIREFFHHDVAEWLDAAHDEEKRNELVAKGLIDDNVGTTQEVRETEPNDGGAAGGQTGGPDTEGGATP